jgi:hypothetical protein
LKTGFFSAAGGGFGSAARTFNNMSNPNIPQTTDNERFIFMATKNNAPIL